ncbi:MAG TPA: DUF742 domain-containing protein [Jatrophihabitantaceae bacterium]|jgi:hypothetical protein
MPAPEDSWPDEAAGPVVRPYAVIRGRTRPRGEPNLDLLAIITRTWRVPSDLWTLDPEHFSLLRLCIKPTSLVDLASDLDLPLGVVRILVADLREHGLVTVNQPTMSAWQDDLPILREVINGLRRL